MRESRLSRELSIAAGIGNSTVRLALMRGDEVLRSTAVPHTVVGMEVIRAELQRLLSGSDEEGGADVRSDVPRRAGICSVVPRLTEQIETMLADEGVRDVRVCRPAATDWFPSTYQTMETLGADRFCAVLGARERYGVPVIVIDCGTATTLNVVDADGHFLGGSIAPGVDASFRVLHDRTAQLPALDAAGDTDMPLIGADTAASLRSGVLQFSRLALEGAVAEVKILTGPDTPVICTGGALPHLLRAGLAIPGMRRDDDILLRGVIFFLHYTG